MSVLDCPSLPVLTPGQPPLALSCISPASANNCTFFPEFDKPYPWFSRGYLYPVESINNHLTAIVTFLGSFYFFYSLIKSASFAVCCFQPAHTHLGDFAFRACFLIPFWKLGAGGRNRRSYGSLWKSVKGKGGEYRGRWL